MLWEPNMERATFEMHLLDLSSNRATQHFVPIKLSSVRHIYRFRSVVSLSITISSSLDLTLHPTPSTPSMSNPQVKPSTESLSHLVSIRFLSTTALAETLVSKACSIGSNFKICVYLTRLFTGYRVGQVRVVFTLPRRGIPNLFPPGVVVPQHLAYIEWFTAFPSTPEPNHGMYKISRCLAPDGGHLASVIPVVNIRRSAHLFPRFRSVAPREWKSSTVLDECRTFFVSSFLDRHTYATVY